MRAAGNIRGAGESGGNAESGEFRSLAITRTGSESLTGAVPGDSSINVAPFVIYASTGNRFADNAVDGFGSVCPVPDWLDPSKSLVCRLWWDPIGAAVGDVDFLVGFVVAKPGNILDSSLASTIVNSIQSVSNQDSELMLAEVVLDPPDLEPGDLLFLFIARIATAGNLSDTFAGDVEIVDLDLRARVR